MQSLTSLIIALAATAGIAQVSAAPSSALATRQTGSGELTYYAPGLGACGVYNSEDDAVVAVAWEFFDQYTPAGNPNNNALCGRRIQINLNEASAIVTVADRCAGCKGGDLDVPVKVFQSLADPNIGRIPMSWNWVE